MEYLAVLYAGSELHEFNFSNFSQARGASLTAGGGEGDAQRVAGLLGAHLTISPLETGIHVSSLTDMQIRDGNAANCVLSIGDTARVTENTALAVLEKRALQGSISLQNMDKITFGRSAQNDVRMNGAHVSGNHAAFTGQNGAWIVEDLGSMNGTFVNGKAVSYAALVDGDSVFIGGWKFWFRGGALMFEYAAGETVFSAKLGQVTGPSPAIRYPFFQRSPRIKQDTGTTEIEILSPPNRISKPSVSWLSVLLPPVLMAAVMFGISTLTKNRNILYYTLPMSGVSVTLAIVNHKTQMKKWKETQILAAKKYAEHLKERDDAISAAETRYLAALAAMNPGVSECAGLVSRVERRLWERSPEDADFLDIRLGTGRVASNVHVKIPSEQLSIEEDQLLLEAKKLREKHSVLTGVPVTHSFMNSTVTGLVGNRPALLKTAFTVLTGAATLHSYEDLKIVCVYPPSEKREWEWVRWLPHVWDAKRERRFVAGSPDEAKALLRELGETLRARRRGTVERPAKDSKPEAPFYLLMLADKTMTEDSGEQFLPEFAALGMTVVYAYGHIGLLPGGCQSIIDCGAGPAASGESVCTLQTSLSAADRVSFAPEKITPGLMDAFARSLAPVRLRSTSQAASMPSYITFLQGYEVNRVEELDVLGRWAQNQPYKSISAPIGIKENGEVFNFDIHEKGMGPHGIVAGATRWGKSETLTTWLLSVALNFPPHEVSFVLIDFKGDGLSGILLDLPHVAGVISNVNDITSIERNLRSLQGELLRRQRVFMETKLENIHKYQEAYRAKKVSEPMAYLIIVIDEFAELKTQFPDQMNGFISVARVGGSLGVYMVLATQSPGGIVAGQVSANSRFRICLKTSEVGESREILGTPDAFRITTRGRGYVKVGNNEVYDLVQTFYSKAPYQPASSVKGPPTKINIVAEGGERIIPEVYEQSVKAAGDDAGEGRAVAQYIKNAASSALLARPVWTDALPEKMFLSSLLAGREAFKDGAWQERSSGLSVIAGLADDPENQTQYPLKLNFAENGHQILYGAPSSGKTTFLQTVLLSAALTYTPGQVQFLVLDFGNWGMKIFEQLPHTLQVADANDADKLKKAEEYMLSEMGSRKRRFAEQGVGTLDAYREVTGESIPAVLIAVDNMAALYDRTPDLLDTLISVAREGGGLGLYLLLTAGSPSGFMFRIAQHVKVFFALQLTDRADYRQLVGGTGKQEPGHFPGRGFAKGPLEFQTALCAEGASEGERVKQLRELCAAMNAAWMGARASLSAAPKEVDMSELSMNEQMVQIGIDQGDSGPFAFVFKDMNGLVISGPPGSGKTNVLALITRALGKDPDTRLCVYEKNTVLEPLGGASVKAARDGAAFDGMLPELMEEYDRRVNGGGASPRIALCIDEFSQFYAEISDDTADKLTRLVAYGEEYGIYIYIAGDTAGLEKFHSLEVALFKSCLENRNALALGKGLKEHSMFGGLHGESDFPLGAYECAVLHGGKVSRVRLAQA